MAWRITNKGQLDSMNFRFRATVPTSPLLNGDTPLPIFEAGATARWYIARRANGFANETGRDDAESARTPGDSRRSCAQVSETRSSTRD
jgi:phage terminase Nu1 subunit (DNA packaging protein)